MYWSGKDEQKDQVEEFTSEIRAMVERGGLLLDVGCGSKRVASSFIGVDAYEESPEVNVQAYMWDMPFEDGSVDGMTCLMALEHISKFHVGQTLREFSRVLKPGAKLLIIVPDLIYCITRFLENPTVEWEMDLIFGLHVREDGIIHDGEFHKTGFTKEILHWYFNNIPGLEIENIYTINTYAQNSLGLIAVKEQVNG